MDPLNPPPAAKVHAHAWVGAVAVFGLLFHSYESICDQVVNAMHESDEAATAEGEDATEEVDDKATEEVDDDPAEEVDDDASAATAQAGEDSLHQQKMSGKDPEHQLRYDIWLWVQPSKDADKTMIAAAKKVFNKAKEMDDTLVIYPWFKNSTSSNIQASRLVPKMMGTFKTYFKEAICT
jgi:ABC-type Zn2+ transport system substrate-binding protein/surface adhesin